MEPAETIVLYAITNLTCNVQLRHLGPGLLD